MVEFVLIIPLIAVIIALLLYFGRLVVRVHHNSLMARYETWRQAAGAPGPSSDDDNGHPLLNAAFFNNNASSISHIIEDNGFPDEPYQDLIDAAGQVSPDAQTLADALVYRQGGGFRNSHGHREGFGVLHDDTLAAWERLNSVGADVGNPEETPLARRHYRIGHDWLYNTDWRASADIWARSGRTDPHPLRARRDAFYLAFDQGLDNVDGSGGLEYSGGRSQVPGNTLAGMVRELYLQSPAYRGPLVP